MKKCFFTIDSTLKYFFNELILIDGEIKCSTSCAFFGFRIGMNAFVKKKRNEQTEDKTDTLRFSWLSVAAPKK